MPETQTIPQSKWSHRWQVFQSLFRTTVRDRNVFHSTVDGSKAFFLKIVANTGHPLRKWFKPKITRLRITGVADPIYVRRCTSDFLVVEDLWRGHQYGAVTGWDIPRNATILDFGTNIGLAAVYFNSVFPEARIVAVEPDSSNIDMIHRNCAALEKAGRLQLFQGFVSAQDGVATIDRGSDHWSFKMVEPVSESQEKITCYSVQTILDRAKMGPIDLLKCDIEGAESALFAECGPWIQQVRHLIVETHPPYNTGQLYAHLRAAGWNFEVTGQINEWMAFLKRV